MTDPRRPTLRDEAAPDFQVKLRRLDERLRAAYVEGAEEQSRRALGRGLTAAELHRVLRRYPGDL